MKKTLNTIFDEASAREIETLVSQNAAAEVSADTLSAIKNKVYAQTGITNAKKKKSFVFRWQSYAVAACLLLLVGGILSAPAVIDLFRDVEPSILSDQVLPTDIDKILWADANPPVNDTDKDSDHVDALAEWNGWTMDYSLYEALNRADETDFIAIVVQKNNSADLDSFNYNGTTWADLQARQAELRLLESRLIDFPKVGEQLKYGELLCTTGTPDGEKWTKELYEETVAYYGEDLIARYIIGGQFKADLLEEDLQACRNRISEIRIELEELQKAYRNSSVDDVEDTFVGSGVCTVARNGYVFLFVQKDELAKLEVDGKEHYLLSLANRTMYEGTSVSDPNANMPDDVIDEPTVNEEENPPTDDVIDEPMAEG